MKYTIQQLIENKGNKAWEEYYLQDDAIADQLPLHFFKLGANFITEEHNQINKELLEALKEARADTQFIKAFTTNPHTGVLIENINKLTIAINKAEQHLNPKL